MKTDIDLLLFLDFDGVLHPISGALPFQRRCIERLENFLQRYPSLQIVISSTWRFDRSLQELQQLLGNTIGERIIGATPEWDDPFTHHLRYQEVKQYLTDQALQSQAWVALDDERGNYPEAAPAVITDSRRGITDSDILKLLQLINNITPTNRCN